MWSLIRILFYILKDAFEITHNVHLKYLLQDSKVITFLYFPRFELVDDPEIEVINMMIF